MPEGLVKILCITQSVFIAIQNFYRTFCQGLIGRPTKRSLNTVLTTSRSARPPKPTSQKEHFSTYEPSAAINVNECDYRRWCRVSEWFKTYGQEIYE